MGSWSINFLLSAWLVMADPIPPKQPVNFSHKRHAAIACATCHPQRPPGKAMGIAQNCRNCHPAMPARRIAWQRVYEVPHFVWFSHQRHRKTDCATCHGPVAARDALWREVDVSMKNCRTCHRQQNAKATCGTCHEER